MEDRSSRFGLDPFSGRDTRLWQGTVISNHAKQLRLVVSADCDLAPTKRAGSFFYLDVLTAEAFVSAYAAPDSARDRLDVILDSAKEVAANRNPRFAAVSMQVFEEWLRNSDRERLTRDLKGAHPAELDLMQSLALASRTITHDTSSGPKSGNTIYVTCANAQQEKKTGQINRKLRELFQARLQSSRFDHFILPEMPGEPTGGHFVPFRSVREMKRYEVCENRMELADDPTKFYPVAVCRPVLLQALLQRFSTYFMRIGFTDQFKTQQDQVVVATLETVK